MSRCIFCEIIKGAVPAQIIDSSETVIVFADRSPKALTHLLIVPKQHEVDIQSLRNPRAVGSELFAMAQQLARRLAAPGHFKFQINSGTSAGQEVLHLHAHFLSHDQLLAE